MRRISDVVCKLLASAVLAGCGSSSAVERYPRGPQVGNQGGSSDVVFTVGAGRSAPDWEFARLDDSLNIRGPYQTDVPPDLSDLRFLYLNPRSDQIYYYQTYYRHR